MRAILFAALFATSASAEPLTYQLVPDPKAISFTYEFDNRAFTGFFPNFDADIVLDWDKAANSAVDVVIATGDATAGFIFATQTLRGPEVLWSREFPEMSFNSTSARATQGGAVIDGDLTIRDVTLPVSLNVELFRPTDAKIGERDRLKFKATTTVTRSDFGANGYLNLVSDELDITISAEIRRVQ